MGAVGEAKLGLEGGEDLLLDLLHRVAAEGADLQGLAHLSVTAHRKQHLQLLRQKRPPPPVFRILLPQSHSRLPTPPSLPSAIVLRPVSALLNED